VQETIQVLIIHEYFRTDKVQESEQLLQVVLQRRPRDQQPPSRHERPHNLREDRIDILDAVRLVDNDILKRELFECRLLDKTHLICRYADLEVLRNEAVGDDLCTLVFRPRKENDVKIRRPPFEFAMPILEGRLGNDDKMGAGNVPVVFEISEEGDGLQSFTETLSTGIRYCDTFASRMRTNHFIGKDSIKPIMME